MNKSFVVFIMLVCGVFAQAPANKVEPFVDLPIINEPISAKGREKIVNDLRLISGWLLTMSEPVTDDFYKGYLLGQSDFAAACANTIAVRREIPTPIHASPLQPTPKPTHWKPAFGIPSLKSTQLIAR